MPLPEVNKLRQQIDHLIRYDKFGIAASTVESFTNRIANLHRRISGLPFIDANAMHSVLYTQLEKVLMRFEELEWLGPQSGPVTTKDKASDAIHTYGIRLDKIDGCLESLPLEKKLATSAVLHRELGLALTPFEQHRWLRNRRVTQNFVPQSRLCWN